jgi:hypothetical protein
MSSYRHILMAAAWAIAVWVSSASATTFQFTHEFSGDTDPQGTFPWVTVEFSPGPSAGIVAIRIDTTNLIGEEYLSELYLNLKPQFTVADLNLTLDASQGVGGKIGAFDTPDFHISEDAYKADGDGYYDIWMDFATHNPNTPEERFGVGEVETLFLLASGPGGLPMNGLTATSFYAFSTPAGGHGPFLGAAHIQAIEDPEVAEGPELGGWIAVGDDDGGPTPFPEPATISLLTLGGVAILARKHR